MANEGLKKKAQNLELELGIFKAYLNINSNDSNLILDIDLIKTKGFCPIIFNLYYNHQRNNILNRYNLYGFNSIYDMYVEDYGNTYQVLFPDSSYYPFYYNNITQDIICDLNGYTMTKTLVSQNSDSDLILYEITDKNNNRYKLNDENDLYEIVDNVGNKIEYSDNQIHVKDINNNIKSIINLTYDNNVLHGLSYLENNINQKNVIVNTDNLNRIIGILLKFNNETIESYSISYGNNYIEIYSNTLLIGYMFLYNNNKFYEIRKRDENTYRTIYELSYSDNLTIITDEYNRNTYYYFDDLDNFIYSKNYYNEIYLLRQNQNTYMGEYEISLYYEDINNNKIGLNNFNISNITRTLTNIPAPYNGLSNINFYLINKTNNNQTLSYNLDYSNINNRNIAIIFLIKNESSMMDDSIKLKLNNNLICKYDKVNNSNYYILSITLDRITTGTLTLEINNSISNIIISDMIIINDSDSNYYKYDSHYNLIEDLNNKYSYTSNNRIKELISKNKYESYSYYSDEYRKNTIQRINGIKEINLYSNIHEKKITSNYTYNNLIKTYKEVEQRNEYNNPTLHYINQNNHCNTYSYDNYQRIINKEFENEENIYYAYNSKSFLNEIKEGISTNIIYSKTNYSYDNYNNISNVVCLNQSSIQFEYTNNLLSKTKLSYNTLKEYNYDNRDRISNIKDNINTLYITYNNDLISSLELKNNNDNTQIIFTYNFEYNNKGLLRYIKDINNNILREYNYDSKDRLISDLNNNLLINYQYDNNLELIKYTYNNNLDRISYINDLSNYIGYSPEVLDNYKSYNQDDYFCYFYKDYYLRRNNNIINSNRTFEYLYIDRIPCIKIDNNNSLSYYVGDYTSSHTICFWIYPKSLSNQTILMIEQEFDDGDDTIIITALRLEIYNNKLRIRTYNTSTYNEIDNLNIDTWNYIGFNIIYGNEIKIVLNNKTYEFNLDYSEYNYTTNIIFNNGLEKYISTIRYSTYLHDIDDLINYYAITKKYIIERYEYINKESKIQYFNNDNVLNIIPFNNRLTNFNEIPYYESFNDKMNTLFLYDKTNKREYLFVNKNIIKNSIPSNTKKISFKFKMVFRRERHDIIKFNFSNNYVILFIENNILKLSINNNIVSTNENLSYNTWIETGIVFYNNIDGILLLINNTVYGLPFSINGDKEIELGSINYPLYGYIGDIYVLNDTGNNPSSIYSELKYDEFDRLVERRNNIISNKYVYTINEYDGIAYLEPEVQKEIIKFGNTEYERQYQYDNRGNITKIIDSYFGNKDYKYNKEDYLINDTNSNINKYQYDSNGNISLITNNTYQYDNNIKDKLSSFNNYNLSYDNNYNITYIIFNSTFDNSQKILTITYEGKKIKTLYVNNTDLYNYEYNELGLRKSKNNVLYYYDNKKLIKEVNGNNIINYLYDSSDYLIGFRYNNTNHYYVRDMQGLILGIINNNGVIEVKYDYDGFGNPSITYGANSVAANVNNILYKGYYYDKESGLYYLYSRYYNPAIKRFMSLDSIEYLSFDRSRCFNLYAYCNNNPVMYYDPDGNDWLPNLWKFIGGAIGAGFGAIVGAAIGYIPGAIIGGISGMIVGIELAVYIDTEIYVRTNDVKASNEFANMDTYKMTRKQALAYIRYLRENDEELQKNWTEGEMLREWEYHKNGYNLFKWQNENDKNTFAYHLKNVDYEKKQDFVTYFYRFLGNLIFG